MAEFLDALDARRTPCPDAERGKVHARHHWRPDMDRQDFESVEEHPALRLCEGKE